MSGQHGLNGASAVSHVVAEKESTPEADSALDNSTPASVLIVKSCNALQTKSVLT